MSRLSFALTIAALVCAIVLLSAFALHALFASYPDNPDSGEATEEMTKATGTTEETTAPEETTALEETTGLQGAGGVDRPPESVLSHGEQVVRGTLGSYCWSRGGSSVCADAIWPLIPSKQKTLTVPSDSKIVLRYGGKAHRKQLKSQRTYSTDSKRRGRIVPTTL